VARTNAVRTNKARTNGISGTQQDYAESAARISRVSDCLSEPGSDTLIEMKSVYKIVLIASIAVAVLIYGLFFNRLSETAMVRWAYLWFPGLVYGAVGLMSGEAAPRRPIIVALISLVALFIFFEGIFPSL
jgi:hypothetical protein